MESSRWVRASERGQEEGSKGIEWGVSPQSECSRDGKRWNEKRGKERIGPEEWGQEEAE